jgi:uncharacterized protein YutD
MKINKKLSESIAKLEDQIIEYEKTGNKRARDCARMVLERLKKQKTPFGAFFSKEKIN